MQQLQGRRQGRVQALLVLACPGCLIGGHTNAVDVAWLGNDGLALLALGPPSEDLDGDLCVASAVDYVRSNECRLHLASHGQHEATLQSGF